MNKEQNTNFTNKSLVVAFNISTKGMDTDCSSKALKEYKPIFDATVVELLQESRYKVAKKSSIPEFGIGEGEAQTAKTVEGTDALGLVVDDRGNLYDEIAGLDLLGYVPSYGLVSRYGLIPAMSSATTIGLIAKDIDTIKDAIKMIAKKDPKDSGSVDVEIDFEDVSDLDIKNIEDTDLKDLLELSDMAFKVLSAGELATNMERIDGIVIGHRTKDFENIDDLYKNSRSESIGKSVKEKILLGNYLLLEENYNLYYEKAMRARTKISERLNTVLETTDLLEITPEYLKMIKLAGLGYAVTRDNKIYTTKQYDDHKLLNVIGRD